MTKRLKRHLLYFRAREQEVGDRSWTPRGRVIPAKNRPVPAFWVKSRKSESDESAVLDKSDKSVIPSPRVKNLPKTSFPPLKVSAG